VTELKGNESLTNPSNVIALGNAHIVVDPRGNLYEPGLAERIAENVHTMTPKVLRRHYGEYERMLELADQGVIELTSSDRVEIDAAMALIAQRLDEIVPKMAADITDHDRLSGFKSSAAWPAELPEHTKLIHFHFVELIHAWNLNPFKRDMPAVASVDESAEAEGRSRFAFVTKGNRDGFLEFYGLDDFVLFEQSDENFFYVELTNKFNREEANQFLTTYRSAMNTLAVIHEERERAIRNDGGKVGFICVDHFAAREVHELMRIRQAREMLGAPNARF
jgi:hypothetical protein